MIGSAYVRVVFLTCYTFLCLATYAERVDGVGDGSPLPYFPKKSFTISPLFKDPFPSVALQEGLLTPPDKLDSVQQIINKAHSVLESIRASGNYVRNLTANTGMELPVGISKTIGNIEYTIGIASITLKPQWAELEVYMQFELPQNNQVLTFAGREIKFTNEGGISSNATLELVGDFGIYFNNKNIQLLLKGSESESGGTFVTFNCNGFEQMNLDAEINFSREILLPEDFAGNILPGNVSSTFRGSILDWNDLIVELNLPSFQAVNLPGYSFKVENALFDFSDLRNIPSMEFPEGYSNEGAPHAELWRGVYIEQAAISLPSFFSRGGNGRTQLSADHLILDSEGITGRVQAIHLIPLNEGTIGNWAMSMDSLGIELLKGQIRKSNLSGRISLPVMESGESLGYTALLSGKGNYQFIVDSPDQLSFPLWQAGEVILTGDSGIEISGDGTSFTARAILHGSMALKGSMKQGSSRDWDLGHIDFRELVITTEQPYMSIGYLGVREGESSGLGGFPVALKNLSLTTSDSLAGLNVDLSLNLTGEQGGLLSVEGGL
ncbi:MAG: hypothetical protein OEY34_07540, partial [Cyclobacteriaceae bacterium]|nr:hypothetical protein [Cyclobacteriaceae bacterium]